MSRGTTGEQLVAPLVGVTGRRASVRRGRDSIVGCHDKDRLIGGPGKARVKGRPKRDVCQGKRARDCKRRIR